MRPAVAPTSTFFFAQSAFAAFQRERGKLGLEGTAAIFLGQHDRLPKAERVLGQTQKVRGGAGATHPVS